MSFSHARARRAAHLFDEMDRGYADGSDFEEDAESHDSNDVQLSPLHEAVETVMGTHLTSGDVTSADESGTT